MSVNLIIVLCVSVILVIYLILWKTKRRNPYRVKELVRVEEVDDSGQLSHVYHHINGVRNGQELFFYSDGKLNKQKHWVADKLEGVSITFFESGKKYVMANYANGLLSGDYVVKSTKGKVMQRHKYENGKRIGG